MQAVLLLNVLLIILVAIYLRRAKTVQVPGPAGEGSSNLTREVVTGN
jgi:hypothetical protein